MTTTKPATKMQHFNAPKYSQFTTVSEFAAEKSRLTALLGSRDVVEIDELHNTDTVGNQAALHLQYLTERCAACAWQPAARTELQGHGLL